MAIVWSFIRDKTEGATPRTVNDITPIEGGIAVRLDDVTNMLRYSFYILVRSGGQAGTYSALWRVRNPNDTADQTDDENIMEAVPINGTDMILLPPITADSNDVLAIALGNVADPSDAQLQNLLAGWSANIQGRFSPEVTAAVFNSEVNNSPFQVNQPPT